MWYKNLWKYIEESKKKNIKKNSYELLENICDYSSNNNLLIKLNNLSQTFKKFKKINTIYSDINLSIYENENVAILGPNGAGKTTLVETICGTNKQTSGNIEYNYDYLNSPYEKIGMQFQDLKFPTGLTVKDIIDFILKLSQFEKIDNNEFENLLNIFFLKDILNIKASKLSGGQQQRLNVFLSLVHKPKILVLDEFTTGLDISIKNSIQNFIKNYVKVNKISLILISHDIFSIDLLYDRVVILADKKIKIDLSKKDVENKFGSIKNLLDKYIIY